jgi:hypothetical protein
MEKLNTIFFAMMAKGEYDPGKAGHSDRIS